MATAADPRGNPSDPMFSPCYTSHHARLILPPLTPSDHNARKEHDHHASSVPSLPVDDEVEGEENLPVARPWNLRSRRGYRLTSEKRENERARFSVSLTAEEIEEDIYAVTGSRPRRRPKRRPRVVQRQLDVSFWTFEFTVLPSVVIHSFCLDIFLFF